MADRWPRVGAVPTLGLVAHISINYFVDGAPHLALDLIGDLSLIGHQVLGRVVADRAGHAMHTALVSRLLRDPSSWELATLGESAVLPEMVGV